MKSFAPQGPTTVGLRLAAVLFSACAAGACASTPPVPTEALDAAHLAISNAERADAGHFAPSDLTDARAKLETANADVTAKQMVAAERSANEARADAELAIARTGEIKAKAVNADMQRSNGTLIDEIQRNSGANQ
jgi:hypothetical protein